MPLKMSVVVPVYNTGHYLEKCLASLVGQSLPADEYEVIFVDDGSDDGETPQRIDRAAAEHAQVQALHIPNSGWPGKPRNTGIDAARGEYVYFVDHDDWLAPESLERLYDLASRNHADVIIGKIVGHGRRVAPTLFRQTYENATISTAPLMESLTPHKGFRRAFLNDIGLRFPEGKRRLEDHLFVVEAYLRASVVSVLSDYACYHHIARDDGQNAGFQHFEPKGYYANLREAVQVAEKYSEPGPVRNIVLHRWLRVEILRRVGGRTLLSMRDRHRKRLVTAVRKLARDHFADPALAAGLQAHLRARNTLLQQGGRHLVDSLLALAEYEVGIQFEPTLEQITWVGDHLELTFSGRVLTSAGEPFLASTDDGQEARFDVPALGRVWWPNHRDEPVRLALLAHRRGAKTDRVLKAETELVHGNRETGERYRATFRLDPTSSKTTYADGVWDLTLRCQQWLQGAPMLRARVPWPSDPGAPAAPKARLFGDDEQRSYRPYRTVKGNLSLAVETHVD